ncbi:hypothetical protein [Nocardiopsis composta]|uniref:DUF4190 domain-containing protein n=1 Tax=Nocardiopsis composta TaxID=157465 RepID=A0A7W8QPI4_9ACTN|nr:hypothetical protein [Nocardiopsis composta]MBB5434227.1 hypothetical protein [Nocardiopsis composta]
MRGHRPATERFWEDGPVLMPQTAAPATATGPAPAAAPPPPPVPRVAQAYLTADPAPPPAPALPAGPPARTGAAVAALLCSLLTLLFPVLCYLIGLPLLGLLINVPGVVFGALAVGSRHPEAVERNIARTWACLLVYLAVIAAVLLGVMVMALALLS